MLASLGRFDDVIAVARRTEKVLASLRSTPQVIGILATERAEPGQGDHEESPRFISKPTGRACNSTTSPGATPRGSNAGENMWTWGFPRVTWTL